MTENHDLNTPARGATDWHRPLNENFEQLDTSVEIRDAADSLGEYSPKEGAKFLALDTEEVFVGTGSEWRPLETAGRMPSLRGIGDGVRFVEPGEDIQAAIDDLAEPNADGTQGGLVKLAPGIYEPADTIWLKAGVTVEGFSHANRGNRRNMSDIKQTVITTANLPTGAGDIDPSKGVNSYSHADPTGEEWHPHFPVVANYRTQPFELRNREPTEAERRYWGNNIGLRNVHLRATTQRWSEEDTYFGVYDASIFSRARNVWIENVTTSNFLGYGGFFNGCENVRDLGSVWQGGATDYHCTALTIHTAYPPDPAIPTTNSVWDVAVKGPTPAMHIDITDTTGGRPDVQFVSGGWAHDIDAGGLPHTTIVGQERTFLGSEADYWDGKAPLTHPETGAKAVYVHEAGSVSFDGYNVKSKAGDGVNSVHQTGGTLRLENVVMAGSRAGFVGDGGECRLLDCRVPGGTHGIDAVSSVPDVTRLELGGVDTGVQLADGAAVQGTLEGVEFKGVTTGIAGTDPGETLYLNFPDFRRCDNPTDGSLPNVVLQQPTGT